MKFRLVEENLFNINEAQYIMTDKKLLRYVRECVEFLASKGYDISMNDLWCEVNDSTSVFGSMTCKTYEDGKYTLTLSKYLADEPEDAVKNTIYHELCHYLQLEECFKKGILKADYGRLQWGPNATSYNKKDPKGHGAVWKRFANEVGRLTNQNITATGDYQTHTEVGKAYDSKVKYIVKCKNCGQEIPYARKTEFVNNPNAKSSYSGRYRWLCAKCKTGGHWEVINRR